MANPFKQMIKAGVIKRCDSGMFISLDDIHVKPGFISPLEQSAVIKELAGFNLTTAEIAKLVNKSIPTVEKLLTLSTANHEVQQSVKAGEVSVDVAVDRVKQHGENAGKVLAKDKATATAAGKKKVTRSVIAPEISIKKARRVVAIIDSGLKDSTCLSLSPDELKELQTLINEHRRLSRECQHGPNCKASVSSQREA